MYIDYSKGRNSQFILISSRSKGPKKFFLISAMSFIEPDNIF